MSVKFPYDDTEYNFGSKQIIGSISDSNVTVAGIVGSNITFGGNVNVSVVGSKTYVNGGQRFNNYGTTVVTNQGNRNIGHQTFHF